MEKFKMAICGASLLLLHKKCEVRPTLYFLVRLAEVEVV
jgi:hypothetical protein